MHHLTDSQETLNAQNMKTLRDVYTKIALNSSMNSMNFSQILNFAIKHTCK